MFQRCELRAGVRGLMMMLMARRRAGVILLRVRICQRALRQALRVRKRQHHRKYCRDSEYNAHVAIIATFSHNHNHKVIRFQNWKKYLLNTFRGYQSCASSLPATPNECLKSAESIGSGTGDREDDAFFMFRACALAGDRCIADAGRKRRRRKRRDRV